MFLQDFVIIAGAVTISSDSGLFGKIVEIISIIKPDGRRYQNCQMGHIDDMIAKIWLPSKIYVSRFKMCFVIHIGHFG